MGANSTLRAISEMMQISCDFSKGANSGSCGPGEEVKKENHQNLTPQNDTQVKFSPAPNVWSQKGSNLHPKNGKKFHKAIVERAQKKLAMDMTREWSDSLSLTKKRPK